MHQFPIGIILDSFRRPYPEAIRLAAQAGAQGIQLYATGGELAPENMNTDARKEFLRMVRDAGLKISALCGDLGHGFGNAQLNRALIERSKLIMELAKDMETNIVTTHIGVVPSSPEHDRYKIMQEACRELAEFASGLGGYFAVETGPEPSNILKQFLDSLQCKGVAVNFDPANLVMVIGERPEEGISNLKDYIVHTHAKDGRQLYAKNPEMIYGLLPDDNPAPAFLETPLGEGNVDFPVYLKALSEAGYQGYLTIEREAGSRPCEDICKAADFLRSLMK